MNTAAATWARTFWASLENRGHLYIHQVFETCIEPEPLPWRIAGRPIVVVTATTSTQPGCSNLSCAPRNALTAGFTRFIPSLLTARTLSQKDPPGSRVENRRFGPRFLIGLVRDSFSSDSSNAVV